MINDNQHSSASQHTSLLASHPASARKREWRCVATNVNLWRPACGCDSIAECNQQQRAIACEMYVIIAIPLSVWCTVAFSWLGRRTPLRSAECRLNTLNSLSPRDAIYVHRPIRFAKFERFVPASVAARANKQVRLMRASACGRWTR